jgi:protein TonB
MSTFDYNDDEPGFFQKYRFAIVALIVLLVVGSVVVASYLINGKIPPPRKPQEITISLPPPPPPPPPPPTPPPPKPPPEQKMVEITPVKPNDKPKEMAKSPDKAPGPPGPKASGPPSDEGIGGSGSGDGTIGGGDGQDPRAVYAGEVQDAVKQALSRNSVTSHASIRHLRIKVWISPTGRVTRASPEASSGDATVDDALKNQALIGLQLPESPPSGKGISFEMLIDETRPQ